MLCVKRMHSCGDSSQLEVHLLHYNEQRYKGQVPDSWLSLYSCDAHTTVVCWRIKRSQCHCRQRSAIFCVE